MIGSTKRTDGRARSGWLAGAIVLLFIAGPAQAQDTTLVRDGWIVGPLIGVPGVGRESAAEFFTLGVGGTRLVPNRPGADLAIGIVPRILSEGVVAMGARAGLALPLALTGDLFLIPSAGLSAVGGVGSGGGGGTGGIYGGAAAVIAAGSVGFRAGVTLHRYGQPDGNLWLVEVGLMHVPLPSRRRASPE
ncbi:MAG TPA: hypothetical protein VGP25_14555 [Gemmatimonadaceae bacterium]|nr:hypothetical protein [Gemmatimonadaceae bacterium]